MIKYMGGEKVKASDLTINERRIKMTVGKLISVFDAIKENSTNDDVKLVWLNEVEGRIAFEVHKKKAEDFKALVSTEDALMLPEPYSRMYILYLGAMISFSTKEYSIYSKLIAEYEKVFAEYARYVIRNR